MRRVFLLLFLLPLALSGCGQRREEQRFLELRAAWLSRDVSLTARLTADYGDRRYEYRLSYTGDGKSGTVTVLEPKLIEGIRIGIEETGKLALSYDGTVLDTGALYGDGYTPVEMLPLVVHAVREGYVSSVYRERFGETDCLAAQIDATPAGDDEKTVYTLWFSLADGAICRAEVAVDGYTVLCAEFTEE